MDSVESEPDYLPSTVKKTVKILVVGGFGAGKTTFVGALSEIPPLQTEEHMTQASTGLDDLRGVEEKTTTTVVMDFGRRTLNEQLVLYIFGTPGQQRFMQLWEDLARNALGALVLVDPGRISDSHPAMDLVEKNGLKYAVAVNHFPGTERFSLNEVREALDVLDETPVVACDPRDQESARDAVIELVTYLLKSSS